MGVASTGRRLIVCVMMRIALAMLAGLISAVSLPAISLAQNSDQMLLEADTLTYDDDAGIVTAAGNVRIDYNGTRLVAETVRFFRKTKRLVAYGNVQMVDPDGTQKFADEVDVTDDLSEGFANALRVETTDKTYFASESAERRDGNITTFNSGVYTACKPCEDNPDKAPIWRIKATKIIWNGKAKTIRFIRPRMDIFGYPIAYFPVLEIPDHTVKRKSGFLFPNFNFGTAAGFGVGVPYYWALSPTYDLTTTLTGFTKQGFLAEAEWRQRFNNGDYSIKAAGIYQLRPSSFPGGVNASTTLRGMVGTKGRFTINPRWAFGWNILLQSDKNFSNTYQISGYSEAVHRSEIYLTGLHDRNYFDLRAMRFEVQENALAGRNAFQPWVLPSFDYSYTPDMPIAGGELNIDINAQSIRRSTLSTVPTSLIAGTNIPGAQGSSTRLTAEAEWRRNVIVPGGLMLTPLLHVRGDAIFNNFSAATNAAITGSTIGGVPVPSDVRGTYLRTMATAGLEARWPIVFATANSSHVIEPIGQIFVRPNEAFAGTLGIANEDAQSMVFDATTLFERDKFSGYDRVEGGVRANLGIRYSGMLPNGWTANALAGQSFQLAGVNSFAAPDFVNAGAFSGLETARSDYVGMLSVAAPAGTSLSASARLDETTLDLRRFDIQASAKVGGVSIRGNYAYIQAQPLYGYAVDRHQISASTSAQVNEFWRVFGSGTYDLIAAKLLKTSIGFAYDDECFSFALSAAQTRSSTTSAISNSIGVQFSFRTLGDFGSGQLSAN